MQPKSYQILTVQPKLISSSYMKLKIILKLSFYRLGGRGQGGRAVAGRPRQGGIRGGGGRGGGGRGMRPKGGRRRPAVRLILLRVWTNLLIKRINDYM